MWEVQIKDQADRQIRSVRFDSKHTAVDYCDFLENAGVGFSVRWVDPSPNHVPIPTWAASLELTNVVTQHS